MSQHELEVSPAGWTRRRTLTTLVATLTLPIAATARATPAPLPAELAEICLRAVAGAPQERLGLAAAAGRSLSEIATSLCARLGASSARDWHMALVTSGQRDISEGDIVEILGQPVLRTEADVLALGARLRMGA